MKYKAPRGTRDIYGDEVAYWHLIEKVSLELFQSYQYEELRTPIFEQTGLFCSGIGDQTDIVSKEMYTFEDKGGRSITLRPEGTAPVVRAAIENRLVGNGKVTKLFYRGPMFRYERPQAGRYRQFHQTGVELLGSISPLLDAEIILVGTKLFSKLGLDGLTVHLNSVGCPVCRPVIREQLKSFIQANLDNLCSDCQTRFDKNPLRILDCKNDKCQKYFLGLPSSTKVLCQDCKDHFNFLIEYLEAANIEYTIDSKLVRGLDYYTKTVFEIRSNVLGAQNAICGGGRYDNLFKQLGGSSISAVGFAFGMERTVIAMQEQGIKAEEEHTPDVYIVTLGHPAKIRGFVLLDFLREKGLEGKLSEEDRSLNAQMKSASKANAKAALILGEDELEKGVAIIKDLKKREQVEVELTGDKIYESLLEIKRKGAN